ncbi:MAG: prolipoprotein diacylglyceryl transferase [Hoeflea sp.]|uniref:prolipoprotein diacylglyceryl transferase n=1 Tax=Hoeflea sp. TaxID=1940281 RepID=UPI001D421BED|nr:prolipoprotein diacylglyceryl transferase [Hoeflea sp.]MBU4527226.1 prolipoprotein diacylglyceryl transferase [Alphaproteobacteria bacterium]MBU4546991.1 prolipoprotein diacylglyceryl transferase [Alphaproteobacteria bacterium]MBU4551497.1 prolipoprotein diacylglyceryl transferase [Alphaproteobacteria bacterium]MBV1725502.1 prolipoprotein diacylglyceryl transferase [Hoeflea sp.]MBV1759550.1 prolipoprotein diacylglyceryl transferase [Hoeflea sp.]
MEQTATLLSLMAFPDIDPVIFSIGPLQIRWYGLAYVTGILLGWRYARLLVENRRLWPEGGSRISALDIDDFLIWATVGIVAGGRIGYILFYDFAAVSANPLRALEIWNGGMSFHGGLLGTLAAMILFAHKRRIPLFNLFDVVCAVVPVGLFFGRVANFINAELWGKLTDVPWAFVFPTGGPFARHPTQLYEAGLEGLLLLAVLAWLIYRHQALRSPGLVSGVFVSGYALSRIFVEFYREPDAHLGYLAGGWLTMGMVLSLPMLAVGIWAIATAGSRARSNARPHA